MKMFFDFFLLKRLDKLLSFAHLDFLEHKASWRWVSNTMNLTGKMMLQIHL